MKVLSSRSVLITLSELEDGNHHIAVKLDGYFTERELMKLLNASCLQVLSEVIEE